MPFHIGDGYYMQLRLPLIATFVLLVSLWPDFALTGRDRAVALSLFLALGLARTAIVGAAWWNVRGDVQAVREALRSVPAGASVLPGRHEIAEDRVGSAPFGRYYAAHSMVGHFPELGVSQQHAFVANVFAIPGQQPLRIRGRWAEMTEIHSDDPVRPSELAAGSFPPTRAYMNNWRSFDYMLVINADLPDKDGGDFSAADFERVSDQGFAVLYRIRRPAAAAQP